MNQLVENKMGTRPIGPLLISMALPMIASMLMQALYNVVDSIFVSQVSEAALTAVGLAFPIQNLMIAVGVGTGVGVNALLSKSLGEKNFDQADRAADNGIFLALVSTVVFMVLGGLFSGAYFRMQNVSQAVGEAGTAYLTIVTVVSIGVFGQTMMEKLLSATGRTMLSMICQMVGAVTNIILDPIMIFGLLGCPAMGVAGAAWATVIGQCLAFALGLYLQQFHNKEVKLTLRGIFRPHGATIRRIYGIGFPSIAMMSVGSVMTFCMNQVLLVFSETATAVFGVYFKLQSFVFMPVFGMNNAMVPIISYNYGALRPDRMRATMRLSMILGEGFMVIGFAVFQLLPDALLRMFNASESMLAIGVPALRIISVSFLLAGVAVVCGSVFQAVGQGLFSLIVSVARQLLVLVPLAYLFSLSGNLTAVWWSFPAAELASLALTLFFLLRVKKTIIHPLVEKARQAAA